MKRPQKKIKSRKRVYDCPKCDFTETNKRQLFKHLQVSHIDTQISCLKCKRCFTCLESFHWHLDYMCLHTKTVQKKHKCDTCFKAFLTKRNLNKHYEGHTNNNCKKTNHSCKKPKEIKSMIKEYLSASQELISDMCKKEKLIHEKLFKCKYCTYESKIKGNTRRHESLHLNTKKEFICENCGKDFNNNSSLLSHKSFNHVKVKNLKCSHCEKSFKRKSELARHELIHSNQRPYKCGSCPQAYKQITHLRRHERTAHKIVKKTRKIEELPKVNEDLNRNPDSQDASQQTISYPVVYLLYSVN